MSVGLAIIAKDGEADLPRLLESIVGAFDQVVLVDTGSTDDTKGIFDEWSAAQEKAAGRPFVFSKVRDFEWCDDFGKARAYADTLLDTEWTCWADCDDTITNAQNIRRLIEQAPPELAAFVCGYSYGHDPGTGVCICYLKRERIVRNGRGTWQGRVHEAQTLDGPIQEVDPASVEWVHHKQPSADLPERNLRILESWHADEPENLRVLAYLGTEQAARGEHKGAVEYFDAYLKLRPVWDEEEAQVCRKAACSLMVLGRHQQAIDLAWRAMQLLPAWPDSYLTLGEAYAVQGHHDKAAQWLDRAIELGRPETSMIVNPLDYTYLPRRRKAASVAALGAVDAALALGREAMAIWPGEIDLHREMAGWQVTAKREHTAATFAMCAEQLIAHDEQLKALRLLDECVPHFATDHPRVAALRNSLHVRLGWIDGGYADHYETGGSKPEDMVPDDQVLDIAGSLPRSTFLLDGLREQMANA